MRQPPRTQPSRRARLAPHTFPFTSSQFATRDGVPEVLEHSPLGLSDVKRLEKGIAGEGILVKLFPVLRKDTRSVGDPNETLWIVASPDATNWTPSKLEDVHKANASHAGKAGSTSKPRVKAKISGGKAERQKEQRSLAKGEKDVGEQPVQEGHSESDDTSDEQEEEEEGKEEEAEDEAEEEEKEDDAGEDDAEGDVAGEDIAEDRNDTEGEEDLDEDEEEEPVVNDENEHDTEEENDGE